MPKLKTRKAVAKRCKLTATGKVKRTVAGGSHLCTGKSSKRKRQLRGTSVVSSADEKRIAACIMY